jgi:hypothetical protein
LKPSFFSRLFGKPAAIPAADAADIVVTMFDDDSAAQSTSPDWSYAK